MYVKTIHIELLFFVLLCLDDIIKLFSVFTRNARLFSKYAIIQN